MQHEVKSLLGLRVFNCLDRAIVGMFGVASRLASGGCELGDPVYKSTPPGKLPAAAAGAPPPLVNELLLCLDHLIQGVLNSAFIKETPEDSY